MVEYPNSEINLPLVSVIIPAFNAEKTIRETIESILNQTESSLEIIIVNDGSTDGTVALLETFADSRLKIISVTNGGQARARNIGISQSVGQFISFCDADDVWLPRRIERQLKTLARFPEAMATFSWTAAIDSAGATLRLGGCTVTHGNVFRGLYEVNFFECGSTALVRRAVVLDIGEFQSAYNISEDWDYWLRIAEKYPIAPTPFFDVLYRQSRGTQSNDVRRLHKICWSLISKYRSYFPATARKRALANVSCYLAFKSLENADEFLLSVRWLIEAYFRRPKTFFRVKMLKAIFLRLSLIILIPKAQREVLLRQYSHLFFIDDLLADTGTPH